MHETAASGQSISASSVSSAPDQNCCPPAPPTPHTPHPLPVGPYDLPLRGQQAGFSATQKELWFLEPLATEYMVRRLAFPPPPLPPPVSVGGFLGSIWKLALEFCCSHTLSQRMKESARSRRKDAAPSLLAKQKSSPPLSLQKEGKSFTSKLNKTPQVIRGISRVSLSSRERPKKPRS